RDPSPVRRRPNGPKRRSHHLGTTRNEHGRSRESYTGRRLRSLLAKIRGLEECQPTKSPHHRGIPRRDERPCAIAWAGDVNLVSETVQKSRSGSVIQPATQRRVPGYVRDAATHADSSRKPRFPFPIAPNRCRTSRLTALLPVSVRMHADRSARDQPNAPVFATDRPSGAEAWLSKRDPLPLRINSARM